MFPKPRQEVLNAPTLTVPAKLEGVVRLNLNENPYGPSPKVVERLRSLAGKVSRYASPDPSDLCQRIAEYVGVDPENVVVTAGGDEAIDLLFKVFINPGDEVVITTPTFDVYEARASLYGGVPKFALRGTGFDILVEEVAKQISPRTKAVFVCSPNNPTGNATPLGVLKKLAELSPILVVDEAYVEFSNGSCVGLVNDFDNVVVLRTFSKAFGLAGLRIGYAIACEQLVELMKKAKLPFNTSTLAQQAALAALDDLGYVKWVVEEVKKGRDLLYRGMEALSGVKPYQSQANFLLVEVSSSASELHNRLLEKGIAVRLLRNRGLVPDRFLRVTVGLREENELFLEALEEVLSS